MKKHIGIILTALSMSILSGCGHGVLISNKLTGIALTFPVGDGQQIGVVIGSTESTTATVRGGTTVESTSVSGTGILSGTGGANHITTMRTNAQLNEGYLSDVLTSENCPESVKLILASNLVNASKAPETNPAVVQTGQSSFHSGDTAVTSNAVPTINNPPTVIESVVGGVTAVVHDTTSSIVDITGNATGLVTNITTNIVSTTANSASGFLDNVTKWIRDIKWSNMILMVLLAAVGYFGYKYSKTAREHERPVPTLEETNPDCLEPKPEVPDAPEEPQSEPVAPPEETKPEEQEKKDDKPYPWYKKIWLVLTFLWGLIMRIPPEKREAILKKLMKCIRRK